MQYAECLKKCYNAVDGAFYDAIKFRSVKWTLKINRLPLM